MVCLTHLCQALCGLRRDEEGVNLARSTIERIRRDRMDSSAQLLAYLTLSLTFLGRLDEAEQAMRQAMASWRRDGVLHFFCGYLAMLLAEQGRYADAARVDGAATAFIDRSGIARHPLFERARAQMLQKFAAASLASADIERWRREGERLATLLPAVGKSIPIDPPISSRRMALAASAAPPTVSSSGSSQPSTSISVIAGVGEMRSSPPANCTTPPHACSIKSFQPGSASSSRGVGKGSSRQ